MKNIMKIILMPITASLLLIGSANAHSNVNISVNPAPAYGQIAIGNAPPPRLLYSKPVVIYKEKRIYQPAYMYVPVEQARRWNRYCHRYNACNRPVYFVEPIYYQRIYRDRGHHHGWKHY